MPKIAGSVELVAKLRRGISPKGVDIIEGQLLKSAETVMNSAKQSITDGAVSGAGHVPAVSPNAPNNDTGILAGGIRAYKVGPLHTRAASEAPYAIPMEIGFHTANGVFHGPWPYMAPALQRNRADIVRDVAKAVNLANRIK